MNHNIQQSYPAVVAINHNSQQPYSEIPAMNHNNEHKKNFCQLPVIFLLDKKKIVFTKLRFGICLLFKYNKNNFYSYVKDRSKKECHENPTWWTLEFNSHQGIWRKAYRKINNNSTSSQAQVRLVKAGNLEPITQHEGTSTGLKTALSKQLRWSEHLPGRSASLHSLFVTGRKKTSESSQFHGLPEAIEFSCCTECLTTSPYNTLCLEGHLCKMAIYHRGHSNKTHSCCTCRFTASVFTCIRSAQDQAY